MCIYVHQYFHPFSHLCSKVLYPIFLFPRESNRLTIPFLNSSNLIHSFHLKNILTLSFITFQLSPYLIHCPHKFLQKVVYTLTPYSLIFSPTCVENAHSRKVTSNFLLKQIILSILIDSSVAGIFHNFLYCEALTYLHSKKSFSSVHFFSVFLTLFSTFIP